jgi:hypothetical protein
VLQITPQFRDNETHTDQTLVLDGIRVQFSTYTNRENNVWYLDIRDVDGAPLVLGIALVPGLDLLFPYRYLELPPGILFVVDQSGVPQTDPTLSAFINGDAGLFYATADTVFVSPPEPAAEEVVVIPPPA